MSKARDRVAADLFDVDDELGTFDLLTDEEQAEYIALMEQLVGPQWTLSPKQEFAEALWGKVDWMLWGGAAGGGKSEFACWHANRLSERIDGHTTLLLRQTIPELRRSLIIRLIARIRQYDLPAKYRKLDGQSAFHYSNGSLIECGFLKTDEHLGNYLSAEYGCVDPSTPILMGDRSVKRIDRIVAGDMVATLEGPRRVTWSGPVGVKDAVEMTTMHGKVIASATHPFLTEAGWVTPSDVMATSASSAGGRSGSGASCDARRDERRPGLWFAPATLFGPGPQSGSADASGDEPRARACGPLCRSGPGCSPDCQADPRSYGGQSRLTSAADQAGTPLRADAARGYGGRIALLDDPTSTPSRTRHAHRRTWRHPYTTEDRPLAVDVHQASVSMGPVDARAMWDLSVESANHYVSAYANTLHRNCIIVDEASQLTPDQVIQIAARLRVTREAAARGARSHLGLFTNPGDVGHAWLYELFVVPSEYGNKVVVWNIANGLEAEHRFVVRTYDLPTWGREDGTVGSMSDATPDEIDRYLIPWAEEVEFDVDPVNELCLAFVPSRATDNPFIDVSYLKMLNTLPEMRRRQLRDGDWDTFTGQFFYEWQRGLHVVDPFDIPESWVRARGVDYGSTNPWAMVFGAWDEDGNCYIYDELYGSGLTPEQQAKAAKERASRTLLDGRTRVERYAATVADPATFSNHRGAGRSIADLWRAAGLGVTRAKNARVAGWANVRQYLWDPEEQQPRLFVFSTCKNLIRTIPLQQTAKGDVEDLDTDLEDHALDALRYLLAWRPRGVRERVVAVGKSMDQRFQQMLAKKGRQRPARAAWWNQLSDKEIGQ